MMRDALDRASVLPLYHQLKMVLREKVESGEWQPHQLVPSEPKLSVIFGISRATARRAVSDLTAEGVFYRHQGKGTFVSPPKFIQGLNRLYSFGGEMFQGQSRSTRVIHVQEKEAPGSVRRKLELAAGSKVVELRRLRMVAEEPIILETTWIPAALCPGLTVKGIGEGSLYDMLANEYGIRLVDADEYFEPVLLDDYEAMLLGARTGSPGLLIHRVAYAQHRQPVEFTKGVMRGDRCRYYAKLLR